MEKILITGFSGFVSNYFLEFLNKNKLKYNILGIDVNAPFFSLNDFENLKINFLITDLLNKEKIYNIIYEFQPDYILHLASFSSVSFSWKEPVLSFMNNTNIFLNLVDSIRSLGLKTRLLSIGSSEEYGNFSKNMLPLREDYNLFPLNPYAVARVSQEMLSKVYVSGYNLDIVLTRSFNHIGARQKDIFVISSFAKQLTIIKKSGKKVGSLKTGRIDIVRDFLDVRDVVNAYYLLLKKGEKGEIYNVCSGIGYSLKNIIDIMSDILSINVEINIDKDLIRPNDNDTIIGDNSKIKNVTGWNINYDIRKSLEDILNYWNIELDK
ncbi:MAG TPA: GDP-mannose 4,6-dehydratase [Spirochaetota bacterium]|nr:GDP-mannose 4,6-dehydratase [Spirochaetota bacterium]